jgi:hypothetical protein
MCKGPGYSFYAWQMSCGRVYSQMALPVQENRRIPCLGVNYGRTKKAMRHVRDKARNLFGNNGLAQVDDTNVVDLMGRWHSAMRPPT